MKQTKLLNITLPRLKQYSSSMCGLFSYLRPTVLLAYLPRIHGYILLVYFAIKSLYVRLLNIIRATKYNIYKSIVTIEKY